MAKIESDSNLDRAADEILQGYAGTLFEDAKSSQFRILFSDQEPERNLAGKCSKTSEAVKFLTSLDYIILIFRKRFDSGTERDKIRIIAHELYHIETDPETDRSLIRHHGGDFCELPEHDKLSYQVADELGGKVPSLKHFAKQTEIGKAKPQLVAA